MKVTGTITAILSERIVTTQKGDLRKKDFILQVAKPQTEGKSLPHPDTIGLSLTDDRIDEYHINVGETYTVIFDTDARVGAKGDEVFTKNKVFRMYQDND